MRLVRSFLLAAVMGAIPLAAIVIPTDAEASVSIAIGYDQLVKDADTIAVASPVESKTVWEDGRIYTYTRLKIEQGVAGELGTGAEGWVRTMGGVVGKIGQMVDGEPVFTGGKSSLVFLRKFKATGTWEVSARAQGQYPIVVGTDALKTRRVFRSGAVGVLYPPKPALAVADATATPLASDAKTPAGAATALAPSAATIRLASEAIHDRPFDDVARELAASWKQLHPATTTK